MLSPVNPGDQPDFMSGALLLVDKPPAWTSFDVVNKLRGALRQVTGNRTIKVGHSGTLDPMATGLLLICTGRWTKKLMDLQGADKTYEAEITLGVTTDTYDAEGIITGRSALPDLDRTRLETLLARFTGEYDQYPPAFSAIKKNGKPLYTLARKGQEVLPEARRVKVHALALTGLDLPRVQLRIDCGSGFYVRSLAHDLGTALGCGGHLTALRRSSVGSYSLANALSVDDALRLIRGESPATASGT